jgi:3-hydroxy-9,10-secoandrosta-1,3,5(10)-triene-9,17-dione monooxygenase reductase component
VILAAVDPALFRQVMARWPTGVSVVTAREAGKDAGLTVNAFLSISLSPPWVLISLTLDAETTAVIQRTRRFSVNVLTADQRALSEKFARIAPAEEKFAGVPIHRRDGGLAMLDGTLVGFDCQLVREIPLADHLLFIGEVTGIESGPDVPPLLFFHSRYAEAVGGDQLKLPPPRG